MTNPFNVNYGSSYYYGNPYFKYTDKLPGIKDSGDKSLFNFAPSSGTDSYISSYYNNVIAPNLNVLKDINFDKNPYTGPNTNNNNNNNNNNSNNNNNNNNNSDTKYVTELPGTPPEGLTIDDVEQLAKMSDPSLVVDGKITSFDVEKALEVLEKAKADGTLGTLLGGKFKDKYVQIHDYLGSIKKTMKDNEKKSETTFTSTSSLTELGIDNSEELTIDEIETLAQETDKSKYKDKDGKIDKDEVEAALKAIENAERRGGAYLTALKEKLGGKDIEKVKKTLKDAYKKLGGKNQTFEDTDPDANKKALDVIEKNLSTLKTASGGGEYYTKEGLEKIANGEIPASDEMKAAAKYLLENQGLMRMLGGSDGKFTAKELANLKSDSNLKAYTKSSDEKYGFKTDDEALDVLNEHKDTIDKIDDATGDGYISMENLKKIVDNPKDYDPKLVDAANYILQHPDLMAKLGGQDGIFSKDEINKNKSDYENSSTYTY